MAIYQFSNQTGDGEFGDQFNWLNQTTNPPMYGVPGADDTALVGGSGTISGTGMVEALILTGDGGLLTADGLSITAGTIGLAGSGIYLGAAGGGTGTISVSGAHSTLDVGVSALVAGYGGAGSLDVTAGGVAQATGASEGFFLGYAGGSAGTALVSGAGSSLGLSFTSAYSAARFAAAVSDGHGGTLMTHS